jgi:Uncharacterized protein conserved in bacteria (DUF2188)
VLIYTGRTVHVVPGENGLWNVIDLHRRGWPFPTKAGALEYARQVAAADQPSQVVLFDAFGNVQPIVHYQLPNYQLPQVQTQGGTSVFEAAVKALLIGGFAAAGIAVLGDLVDRVQRDAEKESAKTRRRGKSARRSRKT